MDNDYQKRLVSLENIHLVNERMFDQLVEAANLGENMRVLDAGSAYGAVTQAIIQRKSHLDLTYHLLEVSATQLQKAEERVAALLSATAFTQRTAFFNESILAPSSPSGHYDRIIGKLLWHEIQREKQAYLAATMHRLLSPGGKLVLWQINLAGEVGNFYRTIVREKDALAGFHKMAEQRHFPNENELLDQLYSAGFSQVERKSVLPYHFNSSTRLDTDFVGNQEKLNQWQAIIRREVNKLSPESREHLQYQDKGSYLDMHFEWGIYVAEKN